MTVGERIKTIRNERGMTRQQLCRLSGVPTSSMSRYENGVASPTVDVLEKIAEVFELSAAALVDDVSFMTETAEYAMEQSDIPQNRILWLALRGINAQINDYCKTPGEWDMVRIEAITGLIKEKEIIKGKLKGIG